MALIPEPIPSSGRRSVLVVDDNQANRELLEGYLTDTDELDLEVISVEDGIAALGYLEVAVPDLILLDVMMPRLSGYQVCERVKEDSRLAGIPIVLITALNEEGDVERAREVGADGFLTKPVSRAELIEEIRPFLERRRASGG